MRTMAAIALGMLDGVPPPARVERDPGAVDSILEEARELAARARRLGYVLRVGIGPSPRGPVITTTMRPIGDRP